MSIKLYHLVDRGFFPPPMCSGGKFVTSLTPNQSCSKPNMATRSVLIYSWPIYPVYLGFLRPSRELEWSFHFGAETLSAFWETLRWSFLSSTACRRPAPGMSPGLVCLGVNFEPPNREQAGLRVQRVQGRGHHYLCFGRLKCRQRRGSASEWQKGGSGVPRLGAVAWGSPGKHGATYVMG